MYQTRLLFKKTAQKAALNVNLTEINITRLSGFVKQYCLHLLAQNNLVANSSARKICQIVCTPTP
jgi:hypothetical protein